MHFDLPAGTPTGRAVPKSTNLAKGKVFSILVYNEAEVETAKDDGKFDEATMLHLAQIDEDQFLDAIGHLFPNGELALAHLNGDMELLKDLINLARTLSIMTKDGEKEDPDDPDDEGFVMENDDNHDALCSLIDVGRGIMERLEK
jgi:hypothetical protein